jgi:NAD(P)-dependent dehydrogenase (short-subunit alcohol dehydrogenase family)
MNDPWHEGPVIVTGGTGLVGREIARAFLEAGARVAIIGSNPERTAAAERALQGYGTLHASSVDLGDPAALAGCFDTMQAALGCVAVLVNGAGVTTNQALGALGADAFDTMMGINVRAAFLLSQRACSEMRSAGISGRILNITSGNYRYVRPGSALYSASKAALESLTRSFALEYGAAGITVNAVAPGLVERDAPGNAGYQRIAGYYRANSSLQQITTPAEVAATVLFLASAKAGSITGQSVVVDSGFSSGRLDFPLHPS